MKYIACIVLLIAITSNACSKQITMVRNQSLTGKWKWMYSIGGFSGRDTLRPDATTTLLIFNPDHSYEKVVNGTITAQGTYKIIDIKVFLPERHNLLYTLPTRKTMLHC